MGATLAQPTIFRNLNQNTLGLRANRNSSKYFRFKDLRMTSLGSAPHLSETNAASKENGVLAAWSRSADHHARHLTDASGAGGHHRAPGGQGYQQRGEIGHRFCRSQGMLPLTRFCPETLANHTYAHFPSDRQKRSRLLSRHVQPAPHPR